MPGTLLLIAPIGLPLVAAAGYAAGGARSRADRLGIVTSILLLVAAGTLATEVTRDGPVAAWGGLLRADALSAWMLLVVAAVTLLATWSGPTHPVRAGTRWYGILLHLFVATMVTAVLAGNLGVLWVAVEATTIVTAFLVGHHRTRTALEAAWKYVVICSAAIAVAFLGTVLLHYAARHAGLAGTAALDWATLTAHATTLDPGVTRIAIALAVIGFGAKAGLAPLHAWLPDAHSQAPAPISALMSGVLLSVSLYAVLRFKVISDATLGPAYLRTLLMVVGLATLVVAAMLLLGQADYKRMLAYSSMEHMGLMAFAAAVGSRLAIAALLLHVAGHGLAKSVAFLSAGHIMQQHRTTRIAGVRALASRSPVLAGVFGISVLALLGLPPGAIFASEVGIARAGAGEGLGWAVAAAFVLVVIAAAAIATRTRRMLLGPPVDTSAPASASALGARAAAPLLVGLVGAALLGVTTWPLSDLLTTAADIARAP